MGADRQALEDYKRVVDERFIADESGIFDLQRKVSTNYHETKVLFTIQYAGGYTNLFLDVVVLAQIDGSSGGVWLCKCAFQNNITGMFVSGTPTKEQFDGTFDYNDADVLITTVKSDPAVPYPDTIQVAVLGDTGMEDIKWGYKYRLYRLPWGNLE
jgi:hypothetical protein